MSVYQTLMNEWGLIGLEIVVRSENPAAINRIKQQYGYKRKVG